MRVRVLAPALALLLLACTPIRDRRPLAEEAGTGCLRALASVAEYDHWRGPSSPPCRVDTPVLLIAADARFDPPLRTSCAMALAWARFVPRLQALARRHLGSPVSRVRHFGSYACRRMTGGGRLSLHARGRALDLAGFTLADGRELTVRDGWGRRDRAGLFLRALAREACGRFAVVLTPAHDARHRDHLHFDIGPYRLCGIGKKGPRS